LAVASTVFAVVLAVGGGLAVAGDRQLQRAESGAGLGTPDLAALAAADRATALRPDDVDAWYVAARVATTARRGLLGVDAGLDRVEEGLSRSPRDPALRALREALLVERALRSGLPADLRTAQSAAEDMIADDPAGPAHHRSLGLVLAARGQDERAATALRRALELNPDDTIARDALEDLAPEPPR
jgi:tetratricopeptide (TPR) repeat protein